jgi:hypothetical protein
LRMRLVQLASLLGPQPQPQHCSTVDELSTGSASDLLVTRQTSATPSTAPHSVQLTSRAFLDAAPPGIAVCHAGADLLMRACYMPETWGMRVRVCDSRGAPKEPRSSAGAGSGEDGGGGDVSGGDVSVGGLTGDGVELEIQDIAGPLCFQGGRWGAGAAALRELGPRAAWRRARSVACVVCGGAGTGNGLHASVI